jgi:quinol monooxygenase YgiN
MIRHIVLWRLKGETETEKRDRGLQIKSVLEALNGKIPGMIRLEVGFDFSRTPDSSDIVLYSEFESKDAVEAYQKHPEHVKVMPFVREHRTERRMADCEV